MNNKKNNEGQSDFSYYGLYLMDYLRTNKFEQATDCLLYTSPNVATIISKVFFSIDTISIFMQLSVCPQR